MKQKTQTLKRIFIFTLLTFLLACEKDDAHSHESEINQNAKFKVNRINEEKLKKNAPKIFSRIEGINNKKVNGDNNSLNRLVNINNDFLIETDEVLEVIEADRTTYTFPITRMVETDFTENLVLVIKDNGVIYGKIVKYDLSEQDKANVKSNIKVNLSNKILTTDIDNINAISAQLLRVSSNCVDYIQIGGPNCPGSLHHTLEQMASGQCPLVNSGNYVPSPEYIVQIIVDMDCDDSNNSGGVIIDESEPTYPGGNYPGGTGNTQPPTNGDTGSTNPPNDPNNNDPNPNQSIDDNPLATYPMIPSNNRTLTNLLNDLDSDQTDWWNNSATDNQKNEIIDYLNQHNSTQNEAEEAINIVIDAINSLMDDECGILPTTLNPSEIEADYNPNLFGDYPAPVVQQDHDAIQQQFNNLRNTSGNLAAVNYLISTYNMNTFGSSYVITFNYTISFANGLPNGDHGRAIIGYNSNGNMVSCDLKIDINLFSFQDFGYITRVIKHELQHVLQGQIFGQNGLANSTREFDAYFNQIFSFRDLKQIQDLSISCDLSKHMIKFMNEMPDSDKAARTAMIDKVNATFPKICPE